MSDADVNMPEPHSTVDIRGRDVNLYTADQLRAAVLAERERNALICDEQGQEWDSDAVQMLKNYAAHCAAAIRKGTP